MNLFLVSRLFRWTMFGIISLLPLIAGAPNSSAEEWLSGRVSGTGGTPLDGVSVQVFGQSPGSTSFEEGFTQGNGSYGVVVNPGTYKVYADTAGTDHRQFMPAYYPDEQFCSQAQPVTVSAGENTDDIDFSLDRYGVLAGRVTDEDGKPFPGITVSAFNTTGNQYGILSDTTDPNGEYTLYMRDGSYRVGVDGTDEGYQSEYYDNVTDQGSATVVPVSEGSTASDIDFSLEPFTGGGTISGRVFNHDGSAGYGYVAVDSIGPSSEYRDTTTQGNGTYSISGLPTGDYWVRYSSSNRPTQYYHRKAGKDWANPVTVSAGQETAGIDFTLWEGAAITGRVTDASENPIEDVVVTRSHAQSSSGSPVYRTDADGGYTISDIAPGRYRVRAEKEGSVYVPQYYQNKFRWDSADLVDVPDGQTVTVDFQMAEGGSISGTVTAPSEISLYNRRIEVTPVDGGDPRIAYCDSNGDYEARGLPPGDYIIRPEPYWKDPETMVPLYYGGGSASSGADPVTVTGGGSVTGIDLEIIEGGAISGNVRDADGDPINNAYVGVYNLSGEQISGEARTKTSGNFTASGIPSGSYRVLARAPNDHAFEFYHNEADFSSAQDVTVTAPSTKDDINFTLGPAGAISGRLVRDVDGSPLAGVEVVAEDSGLEAMEELGWGTTDSDGRYTIPGLADGSYKVSVQDPHEEHGFVDEYYDDQTTWEAADTVEVTAGDTTTGIDISVTAPAPGAAPRLRSPVDQTRAALPLFSWTTVSNASAYELKVDDATAGIPGVIDLTGIAGTGRTAPEPLIPDHEYEVTVRGVNDSGPGPWSVPTTFVQLQPITREISIDVQPPGSGTITFDPAGTTHEAGTSVLVVATPSAGHSFAGWNGDLGWSDPPVTTIVMDWDKSATAYFSLPGDVDGNLAVDLADAIAALRLMVDLDPGVAVNPWGDVNGDGKTAHEEVFSILRHLAP